MMRFGEAILEERKSVLVVDDEPAVRQAIRMVLEGGYDLWFANDGEEALRMMQEHPVNAAVVDLNMPRMGGIDLLKAIKRRWPTTEVVILTGFSSLDTAVEAVRYNACDYMAKPFETIDLTRKIARAVAKNWENEMRSAALQTKALAHRGGTGGPPGEDGGSKAGSSVVTAPWMSLPAQAEALVETRLSDRIEGLSLVVDNCARAIEDLAGRIGVGTSVGEVDELLEEAALLRSLHRRYSARAASAGPEVNLAEVVSDAVAINRVHAAAAGRSIRTGACAGESRHYGALDLLHLLEQGVRRAWALSPDAGLVIEAAVEFTGPPASTPVIAGGPLPERPPFVVLRVAEESGAAARGARSAPAGTPAGWDLETVSRITARYEGIVAGPGDRPGLWPRAFLSIYLPAV